MDDKTENPLFICQYELDVPPIEPDTLLLHQDILAELQDAGLDRATASYNPQLDFFHCAGMCWKMARTYYLTRLVNTEHKDALDWLTKHGYDVKGRAMGWIVEFVLDSGRMFVTGNRQRIEEAAVVEFGSSKFVILDAAAVNLNRVVSYNTYAANLDIINAKNTKSDRRA